MKGTPIFSSEQSIRSLHCTVLFIDKKNRPCTHIVSIPQHSSAHHRKAQKIERKGSSKQQNALQKISIEPFINRQPIDSILNLRAGSGTMQNYAGTPQSLISMIHCPFYTENHQFPTCMDRARASCSIGSSPALSMILYSMHSPQRALFDFGSGPSSVLRSLKKPPDTPSKILNKCKAATHQLTPNRLLYTKNPSSRECIYLKMG